MELLIILIGEGATLGSLQDTRDTVSVPPDEDADVRNFLIHDGCSSDMMRRSPEGAAVVTLCKGWSSRATDAFDSAVNTVGKSINGTVVSIF
jgi:hypothetical protein